MNNQNGFGQKKYKKRDRKRQWRNRRYGESEKLLYIQTPYTVKWSREFFEVQKQSIAFLFLHLPLKIFSTKRRLRHTRWRQHRISSHLFYVFVSDSTLWKNADVPMCVCERVCVHCTLGSLVLAHFRPNAMWSGINVKALRNCSFSQSSALIERTNSKKSIVSLTTIEIQSDAHRSHWKVVFEM